MTHCSFSTVRERDMDLLFLESIVTDPGFCELVLEKTDYAHKPFRVLDAQLSRTEIDLGESDLTVILEIEGKRVGLLIEDKIDAIAMPDQYGRYLKRGDKGRRKGDWEEFIVYIFCPQKYYCLNSEAKKYMHFRSYEKFKKYFDEKDDILSQVKGQIGDWYKNGEITKQQATDMLTKYSGLDSEDITSAVNKWSSKVVTGIAFEDIKDEYLAGNITASRAIEMYVRYGGYAQDKATETVTKWGAEKDIGIAYDDIKDAFMNGDISVGDAKNMYITYGGLTNEKANENVTVLAFVKKYPETDGISYSGVEAYQTYCKSRGVPAATFYDAWKYKSSAHADVDANGETISGSKKVKVLAYINSLNLTYAQKDSLYYAFGWAQSTIYEAPWH